MGRGLVLLVNPNKVHPPIAPYALDVLTTSLEAADFEVEVVDLTFHREDWKSCLSEYFGARSPVLVGVTIRNTDTVYAFEQRPFVGEHKEIITEIRRLTDAPIVGGGIGFSSMPFALVDYFGIDFGVKGPGEQIICDLADALVTGRGTDTVSGLIRNTPEGVTRVPPPALTAAGRRTVAAPLPAGQFEDRSWQVDRSGTYVRRSGAPLKVDNLLYYQRGGLAGILTKNGCTYRCSHCVEPDAKGIRTSTARRRGRGRRDAVPGRAGDPRPAHHRQRVQPVHIPRQEPAARDRPAQARRRGQSAERVAAVGLLPALPVRRRVRRAARGGRIVAG